MGARTGKISLGQIMKASECQAMEFSLLLQVENQIFHQKSDADRDVLKED